MSAENKLGLIGSIDSEGQAPSAFFRLVNELTEKENIAGQLKATDQLA